MSVHSVSPQPQSVVNTPVLATAAEPTVIEPSPSLRLQQLPLYVFAKLENLKAEVQQQLGRPVIDLGMGNPDRPTPAPIIEAMTKAVQDPVNHGYPSFHGKESFRQAVARWMDRRYQVAVDPKTQVLPLIGSKEGIVHLLQAYLDPGTVALAPSFHYPAYERGPLLTGSSMYELVVSEATNYLPNLANIPEGVLRRSKLLLLNYPNNPTGAIAPRSFYEEAVALCRRYGIVLVSDMAYGEIAFEGYQPESVLSIPGAEDVTIEFHSFSKTFNMAGWRLGYAVGNAGIIANLYNLKSNLDYGVCNAIQDAGTYALDHAEELIPEIRDEYQARRDLLSEGFASLGWPKVSPKGSFYLWLPTPNRQDAVGFVETVLRKAGVVFTPGSAFGQPGRYHVRVSLVSPRENLLAAIEYLRDAGIRYDNYQ